MLSHTTAPAGSVQTVYPEAQRVAVEDGIDAAGSTHPSRKKRDFQAIFAPHAPCQ